MGVPGIIVIVGFGITGGSCGTGGTYGPCGTGFAGAGGGDACCGAGGVYAWTAGAGGGDGAGFGAGAACAGAEAVLAWKVEAPHFGQKATSGFISVLQLGQYVLGGTSERPQPEQKVSPAS